MAVMLWVGLGNPGAKYAGNRHNIGFMALDRIAEDHGFGPFRDKFQGSTAEGRFGSDRIILLKPGTFMNLSGQSVAAAIRFHKLEPADVTVWHDELDLAPGKVRLKQGGGHAGHNGLRSIHQHLGPDYGRVRLGIGHPGHKDRVAGYVLSDFAKAEADMLDDILRGLSDGAPKLATGDGPGFQNAVALRVSPPQSSTSSKSRVDPALAPDRVRDTARARRQTDVRVAAFGGPVQMRRWFKRLCLASLALILVAGGVAIVKREELTRLWAVNTLFDQDRIVRNFSNMRQAFLTTPLPGTGAAPLPKATQVRLPDTVADWIDARAITGLMVLNGGSVTHESYHLGTGPDDPRISWSVAKSFLSLLTGILIDDGAVALTDPVTRHAPALIGSAYDEATLEDVLQMESGITFDESYLDRNSDINRMGRALALGGALDDFTANLNDRDAAPGERWNYVSMDTHVVGMVLRGATGRTIPDLMAEKLTGPMGLNHAYYLTDGDGTAFVLGGLNMTLRDYAAMGLLLAQDGRLNDRQIVPTAWIDAATLPSALTRKGDWGYGYQFWIPPDHRPGEVIARGIYGQYVYVDRIRDIVIAITSADRGFRAPGTHEDMVAMMRAIADLRQ